MKKAYLYGNKKNINYNKKYIIIPDPTDLIFLMDCSTIYTSLKGQQRNKKKTQKTHS